MSQTVSPQASRQLASAGATPPGSKSVSASPSLAALSGKKAPGGAITPPAGAGGTPKRSTSTRRGKGDDEPPPPPAAPWDDPLRKLSVAMLRNALTSSSVTALAPTDRVAYLRAAVAAAVGLLEKVGADATEHAAALAAAEAAAAAGGGADGADGAGGGGGGDGDGDGDGKAAEDAAPLEPAPIWAPERETCRAGGDCGMEGCADDHVVQGSTRVASLVARGLYAWCPAHRQWHCDDRGFLCANAPGGAWQVTPLGGGSRALRLREAAYSARELREADVPAGVLRGAGFMPDELRSGGWTAQELRAHFGVAELRAGGFAAAQMRRAGASAHELEKGGYGVAELRLGGYSAAELRAVGYTAEELAGAGFSVGELRAGGYGVGECFDCFSTRELVRAPGGWTLAECRARSAYALPALRGEGFLAQECLAAGFAPAELRVVAGFTLRELYEAGLSAAQLAAAGFTAGFKSAGVPFDEARAAFAAAAAVSVAAAAAAADRAAAAAAAAAAPSARSPSPSRIAGGASSSRGASPQSPQSPPSPGLMSGSALLAERTATLTALRVAGWSASDLREAGCRALDLKHAGFTADDMGEAGFEETVLIAFSQARRCFRIGHTEEWVVFDGSAST